MNQSLSNQYLSGDFLLGQVAIPFVIGLVIGYFAKQALKIAIPLALIALALLLITEYYGITNIDDSQIKSATNSAAHLARESGHFLADRLSSITTKGVSGFIGFLIGLRIA